MARAVKQPVVLVKWYRVVSWMLDRVDAFPKNQRFVVGQRLADRAIENYEMEVPRAMQTFPRSGLRAAALKPERRCAGSYSQRHAALRTVAAGRHLEKAGRVVLLRRSQSPRGVWQLGA